MKRKKNIKKSFLLVEILIATILVALISSFLLSGYNLFLKTGKKSLNYLALTLLLEEKVWDLKNKEANKIPPNELFDEKEGNFNPNDKWQIAWADTKYENIKRGDLRIINNRNKKINVLNSVLFIYSKKEEKPPENKSNTIK